MPDTCSNVLAIWPDQQQPTLQQQLSPCLFEPDLQQHLTFQQQQLSQQQPTVQQQLQQPTVQQFETLTAPPVLLATDPLRQLWLLHRLQQEQQHLQLLH